MKLFFTLLPSLFTFFIFSQNNNDVNKIFLKSGVLELQSMSEKEINGFLEKESRNHFIIQFHEVPNSEERVQIENTIDLLNYIPNNAYYARVKNSTEATQVSLIQSLTTIDPISKISKDLKESSTPDWAVRIGNKVEINVSVYDDVLKTEIIESLKSNDVKILDVEIGGNNVRVLLEYNQSRILKIAEIDGVAFMELSQPLGDPEDLDGKGLHRSNTMSTYYNTGRKYDGTGLTIGLIDIGPLGPHIDFEGRIIANSSNSPTGPGTHGDMTGGILTGAGNLDPSIPGMATGSDVYFWEYSSTYPNIVNAVSNYNNFNIVLSSISFSQGSGGVYTTDTEFIDDQIYNNPQLIHVFSAGNAGSGWSTITGGYKAGKNVITCANLNQYDILRSSSSRGPTADGRVKPDIGAYGNSQWSTDGTNTYATGGGTSAAAPGIAGMTTQLYHAYKELNGGQEPSTALLKACLLNGAEDLGNSGPDYSFGWGRVNGHRAVQTLEQNRYFQGNISQGNSLQHNITVPSGVAQLKVMLYWHDYEGSSAASKALVNDINMQVVSPTNTTYNPWVLNKNSPSSTATRSIDDINNMEQVTLDTPSSGSYSVNLSGFSIPQGPQEYFLVYEFRYDDIVITYPYGGDAFVPGDDELIYWESHLTSGSNVIEYSTNNGASWNNITSVPGAQKYYEWTVPSVVTGQALIRITNGSFQGVTPRNFSIISTPQNITVDWVCPDSLQMSWSAVTGATEYEMSKLGTKYMDSVGTATVNTGIIHGINPSDDHWLSVRALGIGTTANGRRALAIYQPSGTLNCPVPFDVGISNLNVGSTISDCSGSLSIPVTMALTNNGLNSINNITVEYQLNSNAVVSETYANTILPGNSISYTFSTMLSFPSSGSYSLNVWSDLANDANFYNDTISQAITVTNGTLVSLPVSEDFESQSLCGTTSNCASENCLLINGWRNETNTTSDDIDWRVNQGSTPTTATGPSLDYNPGTSNGNYIYLEASSGCNFQEASLLSPCIDLNGATTPELDFAYHMYGSDMGELHVDINANGVWFNDIMTPITGNKGNSWFVQNVPLLNYINQTVYLRIRGITGSGYDSDLSIDDIQVFESTPLQTDGSVPALLSSTNLNSCDNLGSYPIEIEIQNNGISTMSGFSVSYQIDNNSIVNESVSSSIILGGSLNYIFTTTANFSTFGNYNLKAWLNYTGDLNAFNDTINQTISVSNSTVLSFPYTIDLELLSLCNTTNDCAVEICNTGNEWSNVANGTKDDIDWRVSQGATPSSNTGPTIDYAPGTSIGKYMYLEASGGCTNQEAILLSSCIDLNNVNNPVLSFAYHMYGTDMGELHVDLELNGSWLNDITPVISGNKGNSWFVKNVDLSTFTGNLVRIRIRGITGIGFESDMAIDDIKLTGTVTAPPNANYTTQGPSCAGGTTTIVDASSGSPTSWFWEFGSDATPTTAIGQGPHTVSFGTSGLQTVQLIANNSNGSDTIIQNIQIDTVPTAIFGTLIYTNSITFTNATSGGGTQTYLWDFGDGGSSILYSPNHTYANSGIYTVQLIATNECGSDTSVEPVNFIVGLSEHAMNEDIRVYPNPAKELLNIEFSSSPADLQKIKIRNILGQLVPIKMKSADTRVIVNVSQFEQGIYFLEIERENEVFKSKFEILR